MDGGIKKRGRGHGSHAEAEEENRPAFTEKRGIESIPARRAGRAAVSGDQVQGKQEVSAERAGKEKTKDRIIKVNVDPDIALR